MGCSPSRPFFIIRGTKQPTSNLLVAAAVAGGSLLLLTGALLDDAIAF